MYRVFHIIRGNNNMFLMFMCNCFPKLLGEDSFPVQKQAKKYITVIKK